MREMRLSRLLARKAQLTFESVRASGEVLFQQMICLQSTVRRAQHAGAHQIEQCCYGRRYRVTRLMTAGSAALEFQQLEVTINYGDIVVLFSISPNTIGYKDSDVVSLYERMLERIGAVPGVRSATVSVHSPLSPNLSSTLVKIEGYQPDAEQELTPSYIEMVGPAYFKTIGTQVVRGRDFGAADRAGNVKVAIVNETMAHHYFGDRDPIGRRLSIPGYRGDSTWLEIVAVVKDARYHNLREATRPMAYIPLFQAPESGVTFEIRTAMDPANTMTAVLQAAKAIDGRLPISGVKTLSEQLDDSLIE